MRLPATPSQFPASVATVGRLAVGILLLPGVSGCDSGKAAPALAPSHSAAQFATLATSAASTLLTPSWHEFDFGMLPKAGKGEVAFWLHNPGHATVEVTRVETSCPCFAVELETNAVPPGGRVLATARIDLGAERKFVGKLRLEASDLTTTRGTKAFTVFGIVHVVDTDGGDERGAP